MSRIQTKGIFCLEADWERRLDRGLSLRPVLDLLHQWAPLRVPYVHRDVATREEFDYYMRRWVQAQAARYPILYIATHGNAGVLSIGDWRHARNHIRLDEIEETIQGQGHGRLIHFGACDFLDLHGNRIKSFVKNTGLVAVSGYRKELDWLESTLLDAAVLAAFQRYTLTAHGIRAAERHIQKTIGELARNMDLRFQVRSR
ncbi:MAG: hypothetical protein O2819_06990 [Planctomycetota bacterium]|nr:hypothetical protein [Planctomycetota bacterium]MDA1105201.1 hypothetical protein [Planctomycetota bacterium]